MLGYRVLVAEAPLCETLDGFRPCWLWLRFSPAAPPRGFRCFLQQSREQGLGHLAHSTQTCSTFDSEACASCAAARASGWEAQLGPFWCLLEWRRPTRRSFQRLDGFEDCCRLGGGAFRGAGETETAFFRASAPGPPRPAGEAAVESDACSQSPEGLDSVDSSIFDASKGQA